MMRSRLLLVLSMTLPVASLLGAADTPVSPKPTAPPAQVVPAPPAAPPAASGAVAPDAGLKLWVKALRTNDLVTLFHALPASQRADLVQSWNIHSTTPDADGDRQVSNVLAVIQMPNAVDLLAVRVEPELALVNPQDLLGLLAQVNGFLALAASQPKPSGDAPGLDYLALQAFFTDISAWLPTAGLTDTTKLRKALAHAVLAARALGVQNAPDLRALKADDLVHRLGPALVELKAALLIYGLDVNALLDSVTFAVLDDSGEQRRIAIGFTVFGHAHAIPVKVVLKNDAWILADGKDSPFAPISQLVLLAMMMGSAGSDALSPTPHAAPAPHPAGAPTQPPL
jgi:hypothetical protein